MMPALRRKPQVKNSRPELMERVGLPAGTVVSWQRRGEVGLTLAEAGGSIRTKLVAMHIMRSLPSAPGRPPTSRPSHDNIQLSSRSLSLQRRGSCCRQDPYLWFESRFCVGGGQRAGRPGRLATPSGPCSSADALAARRLADHPVRGLRRRKPSLQSPPHVGRAPRRRMVKELIRPLGHHAASR
jgi:hypothetical protein